MNAILEEHYQQSILNQIESSCTAQRYAVEETQGELRRPSVIYRPTLSLDGNQWCMLYGENLHDGVAGFGDTPALAASDFDKNWFHQKINTPA